MTSTSENLAGTMLAEPRSQRRVPALSGQAPSPSVHQAAARASLPQWLQILGPAPWLDTDTPGTQTKHTYMSALHRRQLATLAIGLLCEFDGAYRADGYLHECVRTSLIRWQLSLHGDGRPARRQLRKSPLYSAITASVVQLLTDTGCFQTNALLSDVERHLKWLKRRPPQAPWFEAAIICSLADGALLVRDSSLLDDARKRLRVLLGHQDDEGWFPEPGGVDIGRLSLTVDALARVYQQSEWDELTPALRKALRFLIHFVHPDGTVGGCYGSSELGFLSPYGVELLASKFTEAEALALVARRQSERLVSELPPAWHDDLCALWGSRIALAAAHASTELPATCEYPSDVAGQTEFPAAGISIFSTAAYHAVASGKKGGALHVTWRQSGSTLDDAGITVVFPRKTLTSGREGVRAQHSVNGSTITCSGVLQRPSQPPNPKHRWAGGWLRRLRPQKPQPAMATDGGNKPRPRIDCHRVTHDRFRREIVFGEDWIRIRDRVLCRLPCRAIVCQSPPPGRATTHVHPVLASRPVCEPIFVEGGRNVEITRVYQNGELVDQST